MARLTYNDRCLVESDVVLDEIGIDSVGMIDLVYALEEQFAITINDEDVMPENFRSIAAITALVTRKCS